MEVSGVQPSKGVSPGNHRLSAAPGCSLLGELGGLFSWSHVSCRWLTPCFATHFREAAATDLGAGVSVVTAEPCVRERKHVRPDAVRMRVWCVLVLGPGG